MYFNFPKKATNKKKIFLKRVIYSQELYKVSFQSLHLTQFILKYIITSHPRGCDNSYIEISSCLPRFSLLFKDTKKQQNKIHKPKDGVGVQAVHTIQ